MRIQIAMFSIGTLIIVAAWVVSKGQPGGRADLRAANQTLSDLYRDGDDLLLKATRVTDAEEVREGERLAQQVGMSPATGRQSMQACVDAVGRRVSAGVSRKAIPYTFTLVETSGVNAFTLPGGRVYVFTGLINTLASEDELAAILGHEISHVDLRHAIARRQVQIRAARYRARPAGEIIDLVRAPWTVGYSKEQQFEADVNGLRLAAAAGYDPHKATQWMARASQSRVVSRQPKPKTPAGEAAGAAIEAVWDYWATHPDADERFARLARAAAKLQVTARTTRACPAVAW